jgi:hypothetical protein
LASHDNGLYYRTCLTHHAEISLAVEEALEPLSHKNVIVNKQYSHHFISSFSQKLLKIKKAPCSVPIDQTKSLI